MERNLKNFGEGVKAFGRMCSVAIRQARQSEIDVLSRGRIRERYGAGAESSTRPRHTEAVARAGNGVHVIRRCWAEANRQATQSEIDVLARRRFRAFHEPGGSDGVARGQKPPEEKTGYPCAHPGQAAHSLQGSC